MPTGDALKGHFAMLAFSALVAGSFSLGGRTANLIAPEAITALRFPLAALMLGAAAWGSGALKGFRPMNAPWRFAVLGGLLAVYFIMMFEGLKTSAPVPTAAIFTLTPAITALLGWLILRQYPTARIVLALTLGALGAMWVIFRGQIGNLLGFELGRGELIYFAGCGLHALYAVLVPNFNRGERPLALSFAAMTAGAALMLVWSAPALVATDWGALPPLVWVTILYLAIAATALSTYVVQFAALHLPASKVMAYTYLVPCWVNLWEIALGAPLPPLTVVIGVAMTCLALALLLREERAGR